jgi:transposase
MTEKDLEMMLGLQAPWILAEVQMDHAARKVVLKVRCEDTGWGDPETGKRLHIHSREKRTWRHLDFWQYETLLEAEVPRVQHPQSGKTQMVQVPWAEAGSRWTLAFERLAVEVLQCARSVEDARRLLRLSWETAQRLMERAVSRGLVRREVENIRRLGVDEKSFRKGQSYMSILTDIEGRRVLEVAPGASKESAQALFATLPAQQREKVQAVAMDRSPAYISAVEESLPQAEIVHDAYHLAADLNKAVDTVRRQEHKALQSEGDETLTGTKYLWLSDPHNLSEAKLHSFTSLAQLALKTARAWECKELFKGLYEQPDAVQGRAFFMKWYGRAVRSRLAPVKQVARSFLHSLPRILTWFTHPISNAAAEGFNSVIQALKGAARGFRNEAHYRTRILFHCGKLELLPS